MQSHLGSLLSNNCRFCEMICIETTAALPSGAFLSLKKDLTSSNDIFTHQLVNSL
jgi:hypothetical protein